MKVKPIVAGNWKMNKTPSEGYLFVDRLKNLLLDIKNVSVIFAPPFTGLFDMNIKEPLFSAAQNCHWDSSGSYTGEISVSMIKDCGAQYVILGHSERRQIFGESDELINKKITTALSGNIMPILCIGETAEERDNGKTNMILNKQINNGLKAVKDIKNCIVAYEPVWAIGTGLTASNNQVEEAHGFIKNTVRENYGKSQDIQVLYGGSVNESNSEELFNLNEVDGFLIGGASLNLDSFVSIIQIVEKAQEKKL